MSKPVESTSKSNEVPNTLSRCEAAWANTLAFFKIHRPVLPYEHMTLARLAKQYDPVSLEYALVGMRFEPKTDKFNPADYVALTRLDNREIFDKMVNRACRAKTLEELKKEKT